MMKNIAPRTEWVWIALLLTVYCQSRCSGQNSNHANTAANAVVTNTAQSAFDFMNSVGVNTHLNYFDRTYGDIGLVERELKSLGVRHLRDGAHLQNADYNKELYGRWTRLGGAGIRFDAVLDPRSAIGTVNGEKLGQISDLSGNTIEAFEGPNELDISNIPNWAAVGRSYQPEIYEAVNSMSKTRAISVVGPSMAFAANGADVGNISKYLNYGNLHPYPAGQMPSVIFPSQQDFALLMSGTKAVFATESGYHNALNDHRDQPAVSESAAAKYVPRLLLENYLHGIARTYLYELMDEAPDPGLQEMQMHWGLLRSDGTEKPAFGALKNLLSETADTAEPARLSTLSYSMTGQNSGTHQLLLQKSTGQFVLILWQEVNSYDLKRQVDIANAAQAVTLSFGMTAKNISVYEPAVQASPVGVYTGVQNIRVSVPDHPLVIQLTF